MVWAERHQMAPGLWHREGQTWFPWTQGQNIRPWPGLSTEGCNRTWKRIREGAYIQKCEKVKVCLWISACRSCVHLVFRGHALPLLCRLLHGLAERLGVLHHGFELWVRQHPEQVVQDQNQLRGHHVTVLNLHQYGLNTHYAGGGSHRPPINVTWHSQGNTFIVWGVRL